MQCSQQAGAKARTRSLGNENWRMWKKKLYFTFFCYCTCLIVACHHFFGFFFFFFYCVEPYIIKLFCYCLGGNKSTYYIDEI